MMIFRFDNPIWQRMVKSHYWFTVCKPGFYDSTTSCLSRCGHCKDNATCDKESGRCPNGCEQHFEAPYCQGT